MSALEFSNGRGRDWPQLEAVSLASQGAGTDPTSPIPVGTLPDMRLRFMPNSLGEGLSGRVRNNRSVLTQVAFVAQATANTAGIATNNFTMRIDLYRKGANQGSLFWYPLTVATTLGTAVTAGGNFQSATPAAMTGIVNGMALLVDAGGANPEIVYAFGCTATTFNAFYQFAHTGSATVTTALVANQPICMIPALALNTTQSGSLTAGSNKTITPVGGTWGAHVGDYILIDTVASTVQETAQITTINPGAGTFTVASLANAHSSGVPLVTTAAPGTPTATPEPFVVQGGDVIMYNKLSAGTGLAAPAGLLQYEWVPAGING